MARYGIAGRGAATAATANHASAQLWNPHATIRLKVREIWWTKSVGTVDNQALLRTTARGTPATTVTPGIASGFNRAVIPPSGALLDLSVFSAQPTLDSATSYIARANLPATIGAGFVWVFPSDEDPLEIGPGAGLVIVTPVAVILQPGDVTFIWDE